MRKRLFGSLWSAGLVALLAVVAVPAQAADIKADIPFGFTVNGVAFAPGTYTLSTTGSALLVRGLGSGAFVLTNGVESRSNTEPKLVFHKYGERYILREAWMGGGSGRELPRTRLERELMASARSGKVAVNAERVVIPAL